MVTTFSARLLSLANKCNPLVGAHNPKKRARIIDGATVLGDSDTNNNNDNNNSTSNNLKHTATSNQGQASAEPTMKRAGYYVAHTHPADSPPNKRRRQLQELQFAAATVESALADAGRPADGLASITARRRERALPLGSVDLGLARVVTSREFDEEEWASEGGASDAAEEAAHEDEAPAANDDGMEAAGPPMVRHRVSMGPSDEGNDDNNADNTEDNDESYDVMAMYAISALLQSTRHLYREESQSSSADPDATSSADAPDIGTTNSYRDHANARAAAEDNSSNSEEGLSSWTPSSSCGELDGIDGLENAAVEEYREGERRKRVDNDNRSDEQSSGGGSFNSSEAGEEATEEGVWSASDGGDDDPGNRMCGERERRESFGSIGPLQIVG